MIEIDISSVRFDGEHKAEDRVCSFVCFWRQDFLIHEVSRSQRRITVGRTPLDEWSARRRDLYLTTHNYHNRQTSTPPVGFEPTISAGERPQTHVLDRAATGTGKKIVPFV